jgi:fatty-acyl-CoA synthase
MIISGGENIYPSEVEGVLGAHPQVKDVAIIGVPHDKWGESVYAVVVLHQQEHQQHQRQQIGEAEAELELKAWCKARMAGFKCPQSIIFLADADMPRTATGKILHRVLRERVASRKLADACV